MLTIKKLSVTFGQNVALEIDQEIRFEENDRIGIIGSNGAGKSTLINSLLGIVPYKGDIQTNLTPRDMAVHLQENSYSNNVSVKLIMETILGTKLKANKELQELIAYFDFDKCLAKRFNKLSGGQKQRLTLILVMLQKADLTFFDEVSSGLDFETRQILMTKLTNWYSQRSGTLCVVSHYYDELEKLTNKLLLLDKGRIVAFGRLEELFSQYCGYSVITVEDTPVTKTFFGEYRQLKAPSQVLALACHNQEDERKIVNLCIQSNINYKRRNNDIEIMTLNAKGSEEVSHG